MLHIDQSQNVAIRNCNETVFPLRDAVVPQLSGTAKKFKKTKKKRKEKENILHMLRVHRTPSVSVLPPIFYSHIYTSAKPNQYNWHGCYCSFFARDAWQTLQRCSAACAAEGAHLNSNVSIKEKERLL